MIKYKIRILTKNYITDYIQRITNIVGGRLKHYEKMIEINLNEVLTELYTENPDIKNVKVDIEEFTEGALLLFVSGDV